MPGLSPYRAESKPPAKPVVMIVIRTLRSNLLHKKAARMRNRRDLKHDCACVKKGKQRYIEMAVHEHGEMQKMEMKGK